MQFGYKTLLVAGIVCVKLAKAVEEDEEIQKAFKDPNVFKLNPSNFADTLKSDKPILVEFYTNWCGHCKNLAPEYAKAAAELKADGVVLASMDCTNHQDFCNKHEVQGYPTLRVYRKGEYSKYEGTRKAAGIVKYMKKYSASIHNSFLGSCFRPSPSWTCSSWWTFRAPRTLSSLATLPRTARRQRPSRTLPTSCIANLYLGS
jgi:protein disulfide-isomerase-like protein